MSKISRWATVRSEVRSADFSPQLYSGLKSALQTADRATKSPKSKAEIRICKNAKGSLKGQSQIRTKTVRSADFSP